MPAGINTGVREGEGERSEWEGEGVSWEVGCEYAGREVGKGQGRGTRWGIRDGVGRAQ